MKKRQLYSYKWTVTRSSQPNSITLEDTSINLDVDFAVEW